MVEVSRKLPWRDRSLFERLLGRFHCGGEVVPLFPLQIRVVFHVVLAERGQGRGGPTPGSDRLGHRVRQQRPVLLERYIALAVGGRLLPLLQSLDGSEYRSEEHTSELQSHL